MVLAMKTWWLRAVPLLLIVPLLGSCGPGKDVFAPACPAPGLVKPLAELTRYRPGSQDLRDLVIRAQVVNIAGKCTQGESKNTVLVTVQVVADAARGPAMEGRTYDLPVFVALADAYGVRDKILFTLPFEFPPNVDTAHAVSREFEMELAVTPKISGAAYGLIAGFQLTPEELATYRRNVHR
jgi:hypothetical protein